MFALYFLLTLNWAVLTVCRNGTASDDQSVGWQAGADRRGTWHIITSCLSTIFACTWSIQHLNVPSGQDSKWVRRLRSLKWMIITILFPEFIVLHAGFELAMAVQALQKMKKSNMKSVKLPWLCFQRQKQQCEDPENKGISEKGPKWTLTHCFFANMGGLYYDYQETRFLLTALQLANEPEACEALIVTEEEIQDRSKQDWFAKGVATLQFSQLALSLIVRTNQGLAFSQLETVTLGFAVCGIVIYLVYLYKPQNVETRFIWKPESLRQPLRYKKTFDSFWAVLDNTGGSADKKESDMGERIPNDNIPISQYRLAHPGVFLLALASGLFGAMHAIAWHFEFPSTVERILWQTATVVAAGSPVIGLITVPFAQWTVPSGDAQEFMRNCLRLLREFSRISRAEADKASADRAYNQLETAYIERDKHSGQAQQPYKDIFYGPKSESLELARELLKFMQRGDFKNRPRLEMRPDETNEADKTETDKFKLQFEYLLELIEETGPHPTKLLKTAKTNVFPQKMILPEAANFWVLLVTSSLYCLSRLSLLAVSLSTLRQMPDSVYLNTPWTAYIPSLGSSR